MVEFVESKRPRLLVVSWPCTYWSPLCNINYRTNREKQQLRRLRDMEKPFLDLTEKLCNVQLKHGDDILGEKPLPSAAFREPQLERILSHPKIHHVVGHGCRYSMRHPKNCLLLKKPTLWFSSSPEICHELSRKCHNRFGLHVHDHEKCEGCQTTKHAAKYTREIAKAIHVGFVKTVKRKDPNRLQRLLWSVKKRLGRTKDREILTWNTHKLEQLLGDDHLVGAVETRHVDQDMEGDQPPSEEVKIHLAGEGMHFEVPAGKRLEAPVRSLLKKLHCNLGHPSGDDLKRFLRSGGAAQELQEAVGWLKCGSCAKSQRPRLHRSTRLPPHELQFNDQIMIDCFHVRDAQSDGHWFLSILDRATMYHQVAYLKAHTAENMQTAVMEQWVAWAGTPLEISVDMERSLVSREFVDCMGQAGVVVIPIAGQAHWQHGKIERHGGILKDMIGKVVLDAKPVGEEQMRWVGIEVTGAKNMLVREHGFSPSQLLFGREPKAFGELIENGEPCALHFSAGDRETQIGRRMKYRVSARKAYVKVQASELLNRTARNKTRQWHEPQIGDRCFFFREVKKKGIPGKVPQWLGPALVVGLQGQSNLWVVFGGRCYLVAQEHCREAIGEEALFGRPDVQEALQLFKDHENRKGKIYDDLTGEPAPGEAELDALMEDQFGDEEMEEQRDPNDLTQHEHPHYPRVERPPDELLGMIGSKGWKKTVLGNPVNVAYKAYAFRLPDHHDSMRDTLFRSTWGRWHGEWRRLEDEVRWPDLDDTQQVIFGGPADVLVTLFQGKSRKQQCLDSVPECIKKKQKTHGFGPGFDHGVHMNQIRRHEERFMDICDVDRTVWATLSQRKQQKALDKEIPFHLIPHDQKGLYHEAIGKEWGSWMQYEAAEPLSVEESEKIRKEKPERILRSRYVFRNKNAGLLDASGNPLPIKAKARLCVQGQHDPDCASGEIKVDSPTVQHTTLMLFLHCVVSFGWLDNWKSGDISSAFLQGKKSEGEPLFMFQPKQGIPGVDSRQVFKLNRPVYGRPDAPRAWYESLSGFIKQLDYEVSIIDPSLFIRRNIDGSPTSLIVIHVDDLMIAGENTRENHERAEKLREQFPFGEWDDVSEKTGGITYCGKEISIREEKGKKVIKLSQRAFVEGRLDLIPIEKSRKANPEAEVTEEERTDFRSVLGALQWLSTQTRGDIAFSTNQLQKRVNALQVKDLEVANQLVRVIKKNNVELTFQDLGKDCAVVCWHDASLYNSLGVEIDEDNGDLLQSFNDKKWLYSQKGCIAGFVRKCDLERTEPVEANFIAWKSKTNKRIIESSFAAETHGAIMDHGTAQHLRALYCEILHGSWVLRTGDSFDWSALIHLVMCTDCRSVFDCIKKNGQSIGDKGNALNVAVLRQLCVAGEAPSGEKAVLLWVPTRHQCADALTKAGRHSNLQEIFEEGRVTFHAPSARAMKLHRLEREFPQCEKSAT